MTFVVDVLGVVCETAGGKFGGVPIGEKHWSKVLWE
jgi:hypothetical protein